MKLRMTVLPGRYAIARLDPREPLPKWAGTDPFCSITRTSEELSIVAPQHVVPPNVRREADLVALAVQGPLDFGLVGVLARIASVLAAVDVPILAISTFDTDYVLVSAPRLATARQALVDGGITIVE